jgi:hypothetical protein
MKFFLTSLFVFLICSVLYLLYNTINQSITVDHLQMSVNSLTKRESCLLNLSRAYVATKTADEMKQWARDNATIFDVHEEDTLIIVNEVGFDLSKTPPTVDEH